jgi:hypothetical protein
MWAFLKSCCDASHYRIILQKLEDIYEKVEQVFDGVDIGKFINNINTIAQHLAEQREHEAKGSNAAVSDISATTPASVSPSAEVSNVSVQTSTETAATAVQTSTETAATAVQTSTEVEPADTPMPANETDTSPSAIKQFLANKEPIVKLAIREYMLKNFNITALDDALEGEMYDYLIGTVWDLTVNTLLE